MAYVIERGVALIGGRFAPADITVASTGLSLDGTGAGARLRFDATGLLVLPGIVDVHGDAFERQIMPRPGVEFPTEMALVDTDRQLVANGITTACHGVTFSWEPGLRGEANAARTIGAVERLRPDLLADTHVHLRYETFTLEGEDTVLRWIADGRLKVLAFNDHMESIVKTPTSKRAKLGKMIERSGLTPEEFGALVDRVWARRDEVAASVARIAAAGRAAGLVMMSHDDPTVEERLRFRALGCPIAEFPMTEDAARVAVAAGETTVFGAPNVVRGGSHTGCPSAADMAAAGLATVLASDYYYPAMAQASSVLDRSGVLPLEAAWALVSLNPARALGLADRGEIATGKRGDLVVAEPVPDGLRVVATFAAGKLVFSTQSHRIGSN